MSERDVLFDISRRLTDDEIRAIFLSPMVSTTETLAAVSLRFEVIRARREEENLRAENERLRTSVRSYYNALLNYGRHWPDCATPKSGDRCDCGLSGWLTEKALERAALVAPQEGKEKADEQWLPSGSDMADRFGGEDR